MILWARTYFESVRHDCLAVLFTELWQSGNSNDFVCYIIFSWGPNVVSWAISSVFPPLCGAAEHLSHCFAKDFDFLGNLSLRLHGSPSFLGGPILFGFSEWQDSVGVGKDDRRYHALKFRWFVFSSLVWNLRRVLVRPRVFCWGWQYWLRIISYISFSRGDPIGSFWFKFFSRSFRLIFLRYRPSASWDNKQLSWLSSIPSLLWLVARIVDIGLVKRLETLGAARQVGIFA